MVHARDLIGVNMPEVIRIAARELRLNGMGIGTELSIFKVYVVGLYLEGKTADPQSAIASDQAKRIALTLLRDVSRERFVQAVEKGMTQLRCLHVKFTGPTRYFGTGAARSPAGKRNRFHLFAWHGHCGARPGPGIDHSG